MKFLNILLKEGRKEDLKKKYFDKFDEEVLDFVLGSPELQNFNHKYTDFIFRGLDQKNDVDLWLEIGVQLVKDFDKYQKQLEKKDINQYRSFEELENALEPFKEKEKQKELESQTEKIYEDDTFLVIIPKSEESSCKYGANTKWCVTSKGSGHFQNYTKGNQALYFIINKLNSSNRDYSKIAVHYDSDGKEKVYDSQDKIIGDRELSVLKYAFPEMMNTIESHYKKHNATRLDYYLKTVFEKEGTSECTETNVLNKPFNLKVQVKGFENIPDLGYGHAQSEIKIYLAERKSRTNDNLDYKPLDEYYGFINYRVIDNGTFLVDIGFQGGDFFDEKIGYIDLGLESHSVKFKHYFSSNIEIISKNVRETICSKVKELCTKSPRLVEKLQYTKSWTPNRFSYGYTFGKNKGLIKKLVDWLDAGKIGTKLDFLVELGVFEKLEKDGKIVYKRLKTGYTYKPSDLRGQYSSFFSSAKNAGILDYRKLGRDFFLIKGPNFDDFKEGKLVAL